MAKKQPTTRQLMNLARGREKLFQNQLRRKGINPNPQPRVIIRQPAVNHSTTHVHPVKVQLSLFDKFLETKLFTIETKKNKEDLNLRELLNRINSRLNLQWNEISLNKENISKIIDHVNNKDKENDEKFKKIEKRISDLEKENKKLKELLEEEV